MQRNFVPFLIIVVVVAFGLLGIFFLSNQKMGNSQINLTPTIYPTQTPQVLTPAAAIISQSPASNGANMNNVITTADGLQMQDEVIGSGQDVKSGDTVTVNYLGTLQNGTKFDSSYDRNQPFTTQIGVGQVIKGWDEGIVGMKVGGKRKLTIPASLGYGDQAAGSIPPNSTLVFEVELLGVK
ncbi:MAG TPA: FKBP-type peptidyl-prolyl cis-trans isomerase [Patescibacteria group bacterium]|jgi:FKBP-type peptidyl-prolyl cis-trans isomerase|nr:FKBP-type peptidyl-prolyl cis-trans isomerase [Patescibacteria group bacterium]